MTRHLAVALGSLQYRVHRPWGAWPEGLQRGLVSDVATDSRDNIFVCQRFDILASNNGSPVLVFDRQGRFLRSWGEGLISDAHMICITPDDQVLLVDRDAHQILAFDILGKLLFKLGKQHCPNQPFNHPTDIAVASNGDFYVSDGYGASKVHWFGPNGEAKGCWGTRGQGPGEFATPHGIWVLSDGRVLVGDRENNRIQIFSPEGRFLTAWGDLYRPMDIWSDNEGHIYVSDQVPRLSLFDPNGRLLGRCRPVLNGGHGLCGDSAGNLYLAEPNPGRVTRLSRQKEVAADHDVTGTRDQRLINLPEISI
jgi:hypothetical protein